MWVPAQIVDRVDSYMNSTQPDLNPSISSGQVHFFSTQPDSTLSLKVIKTVT